MRPPRVRLSEPEYAAARQRGQQAKGATRGGAWHAKALRLLETGMRTEDVAERCGVHWSTVYELKRRLGLSSTHRSRPRPRTPRPPQPRRWRCQVCCQVGVVAHLCDHCGEGRS